MAQIEEGGGNGKGKSHQKKMTVRVDFTPMVDMNMLLITFFMLCTTMLKSQTLSIALPSNEKVDNVENMSQASSEDAVTIILDAKKVVRNGKLAVDTLPDGTIINEVYYYFGKPGGTAPGAFDGKEEPELLGPDGSVVANDLTKTTFADNGQNGGVNGIREIIQKRNKEVIEKLIPLKKKFQDGEIDQVEYDSLAKIVRRDSTLKKPTIIIKSTHEASYGSLVEILDEMQINAVSKYQIDNLTRADSLMLMDYQNKHMK